MLHMSDGQVEQLLAARSPRSSRSLQSETAATDRDGPSNAENGENNVTLDVAAGQTRSKLRAVVTAEKRLIAGLIRHNTLFHAALADGRGLDEVISPSEFVVVEHRELYQRVYDTLADGRPLSLASLVGDLELEGQEGLKRLVFDADQALDKAIHAPVQPGRDTGETNPVAAEATDDLDSVRDTLMDAAQLVIQYHREAQYQQTRQALMQSTRDDTPAEPTDQATLLAQLIEHRKANPSPGRIARL